METNTMLDRLSKLATAGLLVCLSVIWVNAVVKVADAVQTESIVEVTQAK